MNGMSIRPHIRDRVGEAVKKLGYRENYFAKSLRRKDSLTIGVVISKYTELFQACFLDEIDAFIHADGNEILVVKSYTSVELADRLHFLMDRMVDGVVFFVDKLSDELIDTINEYSSLIPMVIVDVTSEKLKISSVLSENYAPAYQAVELLINYGHTKIGIISGQPEKFLTAKERLDGSLAAMNAYGLTLNDNYLRIANSYTQPEAHVEAIKLMKLEEPPTAIFTHSYHLTFGVVMAMKDLKLSIPEDVSVIGYDYYNMSSAIAPDVTCVDQPNEEVARSVYMTLLGQIADPAAAPVVRRIPAKLIMNNSVRKL